VWSLLPGTRFVNRTLAALVAEVPVVGRRKAITSAWLGSLRRRDDQIERNRNRPCFVAVVAPGTVRGAVPASHAVGTSPEEDHHASTERRGRAGSHQMPSKACRRPLRAGATVVAVGRRPSPAGPDGYPVSGLLVGPPTDRTVTNGRCLRMSSLGPPGRFSGTHAASCRRMRRSVPRLSRWGNEPSRRRIHPASTDL